MKLMKTTLSLFSLLLIFFSCSTEKKGDPTRFKQGVFEIPAGESYGKTIITRKDSLQIEQYTKKTSISSDSLVTLKEEKHTDTLFIKWKNNFAYTLQMKNPKTDLDKDPIFVQITKVTDNSYDFTARIGYSKFKQKGTVYKVN
ncbi:conserved exported hypothetical protein [Tenacibaculum halocynthiae]|nr:hypothetical protein SAMN04487765_2677 [Tenacibaculum sp. MAR_2010_89]